MKIRRRVKRTVTRRLRRLRVAGKPKIFCIGLNKTGTTSLKAEMKAQGFVVGDQAIAESLFDSWVKRDFAPIVRYCRTAQFFQDAPFSYPYTFIALDQAYPRSRFILTVRDSAEEWYRSLVSFHSKMWADGSRIPTAQDLKAANYRYRGFPFHTRMHVNQVTEEDLYNMDVLTEFYETHNKTVQDYFRHRPGDLLVINLKDKQSYRKFCAFLDIDARGQSFPWKNKADSAKRE